MARNHNVAQPLDADRGLIITQALSVAALCGVVIVTRDSKTLRLTPEAAEVLGCDPAVAEIPRQELPAPFQPLIEALSAGSSVLPLVDMQVDLPSGPRTIQVRPMRVDSSTGVLMLHDLTGQRAFLDHLRQVDRLVNAGTLATSMAHEIKNALVVGKALTELLLEKNPGLELADLLRREIIRIDAIVTRMLRLARPHRPVFVPVNLHHVLNQSRRLIQPRLDNSGIDLKLALDATHDLVSGDADELQQVFVNLLINSLDAMGASGRIEVRTEFLPGSGSGRIQVRFSDNGPGIPRELLPRLFHPFFTTKAEGTGLGLAISQKIIESHLGTISVQSHGGAGAVFVIELPALPA